jgi:hypothetical protein
MSTVLSIQTMVGSPDANKKSTHGLVFIPRIAINSPVTNEAYNISGACAGILIFGLGD